MIRSIYCFDISHITNLLPKSIAAFAVVPDPAKAAIDLGRRFVMCEISKQYIDLIIEGTMLGGDLKIIN
ncbi:hypothetical protein OkiPb00212_50900 [Escherichia coli]